MQRKLSPSIWGLLLQLLFHSSSLVLIVILVWTTTTTNGFQQPISQQPLSSKRQNYYFPNKKYLQSSRVLFLSTSNNENEEKYFLRKAIMPDLSYAAEVLTEGFYGDSNIATKWWEKIQTQMNLESNLPSTMGIGNVSPLLTKSSEKSVIQGHDMWVACQSDTGKVIGFCELDNREPRKHEKEKANMDNSMIVRPYMCNLSVQTDYRKMGIAQNMILQCEQRVTDWYDTSENSTMNPKLYLKVKESNVPAIKLYQKLGYEVVAHETVKNQQDNTLLLVMKREWNNTISRQQTEEKEESSSSSSIPSDELSLQQWNGPTI